MGVGLTHILSLSYNHIVNPLANHELIDQLISFPKCLQRACMSETRSPPSSLPSSLVANPTKEALKEMGSEVVVALAGVLTNKDAVSRNEVG